MCKEMGGWGVVDVTKKEAFDHFGRLLSLTFYLGFYLKLFIWASSILNFELGHD